MAVNAIEEINSNIDQSLESNDLWNNDQERQKRSFTDVPWLFAYGWILIVWFAIAFHAFINGDRLSFKMVALIIESIWHCLVYSPLVYFFALICILFLAFYFIILRWFTKVAIYLTIFLKFIFITLPFVLNFVLFHPIIFTIVFFILLFSYIIFWIEIRILKKVGIDMVCKIITDACKATIAFPASLLISLLFLFTSVLLFIFIGTVIYTLMTFQPTVFFKTNYSVQVLQDNNFLIVTFSICSIWILSVDYLSKLSVLHGIFTSWYKMSNKNMVPHLTTLFHHLFLSYRYHIGTFTFMSAPILSVIYIIRTICTNVQVLKMKTEESRFNIYCFFIIILNSITNTSITCATYGKCFYPSMKDSFKVIINNPMKFAAVRLITTWMIFFGLILIPCITVGLMALNVAIWSLSNYTFYLGTMCVVSSLITFVIFFIFSAAVDSVLFCYHEQLVRKNSSINEEHENIQT